LPAIDSKTLVRLLPGISYWQRRSGLTVSRRRSGRVDVIDWLLEGDPAIRWQVMRDLAGAAENLVAAERAWLAKAGYLVAVPGVGMVITPRAAGPKRHS
jgi:hypothetical protein